jgi:hypothetical protein
MLQVLSGSIKDYDIYVYDTDHITVLRGEDEIVNQHEVPNYGTSLWELMQRPNVAVGWAAFGEGEMEVIYFYDKDDDNFGYALNITDEFLSEWGAAPF